MKIKKLLLSLSFPLLSLSLFSAHYYPSNITWEHTGSDDYVFYLTLIRDCSSVPVPSTGNINGPFGQISLSLDTSLSTSLAPACSLVSCQNGSGYYKAVYKSGVITLPGTPPANGWEFSSVGYGRPISSNLTNPPTNFLIRGIMYPHNGGKPTFNTTAIRNSSEPMYLSKNGRGSFPLGINYPASIDSVTYRFDSLLTNVNVGSAFYPGFSYVKPLPDSTENSSNGPQRLNEQTGTFYFDVSSAGTELYFYCISYDYYQNGSRVASVKRYVGSMFLSDPNPNVPSATVNYNSATYTNGDHVKLTAFANDTLRVPVTFQDMDQFSSGGFQAVTAKAIGSIFNSAAGPAKADFNSLNQGGAYTSTITNNVEFEFIPQTADVGKVYHFSIHGSDNGCGGNRTSTIDFSVEVKAQVAISGSILNDTLLTCLPNFQLNGFTQSGQYQWSPASWVNNSTYSNPGLITPQTGWLYLTDPTQPSEKDSVYILSPTGSYSLSLQNNFITRYDSIGLQLEQWFLNGILLNASADTFSAFFSGDYYSSGYFSHCQFSSDTVTYYNPFNLTVNTNGLSVKTTAAQLDSAYALEINYIDNNLAPEIYNLKQVSVYGLNDGSGKKQGGNVTLRIFDQNQTLLFTGKKDVSSLTGGFLNFYPNVRFSDSEKFYVVAHADTGVRFYTYQNVSLPLTNGQMGGQIQLSNILAGDTLGFPSAASVNMPALALGIESTVGIEESAISSLSFFPNPNDGVFNLSDSFSEDTHYEVFTTSGQKVALGRLKKGETKIAVQHLSSGTYVLKIGKSKVLLQIK